MSGEGKIWGLSWGKVSCREEFKIPMFKIPTFIIPMVQNTNEALSKYQLKVHNTNKLKRVKFLQFKIPTGWYYEHSVHNTNYNCGHGWVGLGGTMGLGSSIRVWKIFSGPITLIYAQWLHIRRGRVTEEFGVFGGFLGVYGGPCGANVACGANGQSLRVVWFKASFLFHQLNFSGLAALLRSVF